jgi:4-alpha-glucanotransferase
MLQGRGSGVLLHVTSLPSEHGIGDFGPAAYRFVDFLAGAKQRYWQVLPLSQPTLRRNPYSPYNSVSAFAGNWLLTSPAILYREGLLSKESLERHPQFPEGRVDYPAVVSYKGRVLDEAFEVFKLRGHDSGYEAFCRENEFWLDDYAMFIAFRRHMGRRLWCEWPAAVRDRKEGALASLRQGLGDAIDREKFVQYVFFRQWHELKDYCHRREVRIIGDVPIYVSYDSSDVWSHPEIFKLSRFRKPLYIAGVPPDYFSRTGQLWGNPVYDWDVLSGSGYQWWVRRMEQNLRLYDIIRIDHFRGLVAFWQVAAGSRTAINGQWVQGPGEDFLKALFEHVRPSSIVVEDLGYITADVRAVIEKFGLACMKVLLFAFDGEASKNTHCLQNHVVNSVVYTGTHDNNTVRGWFEKEATPEQKRRVYECLGRRVKVAELAAELVRLAMSSAAGLTIIPMQDVMGLGEEARMNRPGTVKGNWCWRLVQDTLRPSVGEELAKVTEIYGRGFTLST